MAGQVLGLFQEGFFAVLFILVMFGLAKGGF